ncbi:DUF488 domain-containing protein [Nocardioides aurantiacus]|uniref:DUF488 domain-containing protein n=1 Tax=Nocardioides aurantiacus TaxID=86796 RepID=UPI00403EFAA3
MATLLTFGHGTASQDQLTQLLTAGGVRRVVDVRRFPGSRRHPHVAAEELERWLPAAGIEYAWEPRLSGRRRVSAEADATDSWWRVEAFRAYAAHARSAAFRDALEDVLSVVIDQGPGVAIMCSESLWWRCHRRIISDVVVMLHARQVQHLGHDGRVVDHLVAAGARVSTDGLIYDRPGVD